MESSSRIFSARNSIGSVEEKSCSWRTDVTAAYVFVYIVGHFGQVLVSQDGVIYVSLSTIAFS